MSKVMVRLIVIQLSFIFLVTANDPWRNIIENKMKQVPKHRTQAYADERKMQIRPTLVVDPGVKVSPERYYQENDLFGDSFSRFEANDIEAKPMTGSFPDFTDLTNNTSSNECLYCVDDGACVANHCECNPGYEGDAKFYCAPGNEYYYCYSRSDPGMRTLGGEHFVYHLIGSTRLVHMTTDRTGGGQCEFRLWGWTKRWKGKYYYNGISFRLDQLLAFETITHHGLLETYNDVGYDHEWLINITGPENYADTFVETGGDNFASHNLGGCDIDYYRIGQQFVKFALYCCGIDFALRAYHPEHTHLVPGFWFQVKKHFNPTYENWNEAGESTEPLCLDHTLTTTTDDIIVNTGIEYGKREALTFHALTNTAVSEYPNAPDGLKGLKQELRECDESKRDTLFALIRFFTNNPTLSSCLNGRDSSSVSSTIEAMRDSAKLICEGSTEGKAILSNLLSDPHCEKVREKFPDLALLAELSTCV